MTLLEWLEDILEQPKQSINPEERKHFLSLRVPLLVLPDRGEEPHQSFPKCHPNYHRHCAEISKIYQNTKPRGFSHHITPQIYLQLSKNWRGVNSKSGCVCVWLTVSHVWQTAAMTKTKLCWLQRIPTSRSSNSTSGSVWLLQILQNHMPPSHTY